MNVTERY